MKKIWENNEFFKTRDIYIKRKENMKDYKLTLSIINTLFAIWIVAIMFSIYCSNITGAIGLIIMQIIIYLIVQNVKNIVPQIIKWIKE